MKIVTIPQMKQEDEGREIKLLWFVQLSSRVVQIDDVSLARRLQNDNR